MELSLVPYTTYRISLSCEFVNKIMQSCCEFSHSILKKRIFYCAKSPLGHHFFTTTSDYSTFLSMCQLFILYSCYFIVKITDKSHLSVISIVTLYPHSDKTTIFQSNFPYLKYSTPDSKIP